MDARFDLIASSLQLSIAQTVDHRKLGSHLSGELLPIRFAPNVNV